MTIHWNLPMFNIMPSFTAAVNPFGYTGNFFSMPSFITPVNLTSIPLFNFAPRPFPIFPTFGSLTSYAAKKVTNGVSSSSGRTFLGNVKYNAQKGLALAKSAISSAVGFGGKCAKYVKNAIAKTGLGKYESGHAYQMADILRKNKNFKEISAAGVDLKSLPAGCVLVYGKGSAGYNKAYGHTEITTGKGTAVSDGVTRNLYKKPDSIFVPV